jgi:hypothetical protein
MIELINSSIVRIDRLGDLSRCCIPCGMPVQSSRGMASRASTPRCLSGTEADRTDAHSFFLAALDQIHATAKGQMSSCNCIARKPLAHRNGMKLNIRPNIRGSIDIDSDLLSVQTTFSDCGPDNGYPTRFPSERST